MQKRTPSVWDESGKRFRTLSAPPGPTRRITRLVEIDTTPFEYDGILHVKIRVGAGEAAGTFELFDADTDLTTDGSPDEALTGAWDVPPGGIGQITSRFPTWRLFPTPGYEFGQQGREHELFSCGHLRGTQEGENT